MITHSLDELAAVFDDLLVDSDGKQTQYPTYKIVSSKFIKDANLKFLGMGVSRYVFKYKNARSVIKYDPSSSYNRSEYCLSKALEGTQVGNLLAKSQEITSCGKILVQQYVPKRIEEYSFYNQDGIKDFVALRDTLESCFSFVKMYTKDKYLTCDFHEDNIRLTNSYEAKIIDYAPLLYPIICGEKLTNEACIKKLKKYTKYAKDSIKFFLNNDKELVLDIGTKIYKVKRKDRYSDTSFSI